jgi:hypothetical protein
MDGEEEKEGRIHLRIFQNFDVERNYPLPKA